MNIWAVIVLFLAGISGIPLPADPSSAPTQSQLSPTSVPNPPEITYIAKLLHIKPEDISEIKKPEMDLKLQKKQAGFWLVEYQISRNSHTGLDIMSLCLINKKQDHLSDLPNFPQIHPIKKFNGDIVFMYLGSHEASGDFTMTRLIPNTGSWELELGIQNVPDDGEDNDLKSVVDIFNDSLSLIQQVQQVADHLRTE